MDVLDKIETDGVTSCNEVCCTVTVCSTNALGGNTPSSFKTLAIVCSVSDDGAGFSEETGGDARAFSLDTGEESSISPVAPKDCAVFPTEARGDNAILPAELRGV